jgi:hypothetical protein
MTGECALVERGIARERRWRGAPSLSQRICHSAIRHDVEISDLNGLLSAEQNLIRQLLWKDGVLAL